MKWNKVKLGKIASYINGRAFKSSEWSNDGLPIIRIQNLNSPDADFNYFSGEYDQKHFISDGDLLISWSASLGVYLWDRGDAVLNQHIFKVVFDKEYELDKKYFFYAVSRLLKEMESKMHGATMKHITKKKFNNLEIPLPPTEVQKQIVEILDRADELKIKSRSTQLKAKSFIQALFFDIFGDPVTNEKEWDLVNLGDVVDSFSDGPHVSPEYSDESGIPFLSTRNIRKGELILENLKYISESEAQIHWKKVKPLKGDILYTKGGTTGLAKAVDFDLDFAVWVHLAVLKLNKKLVNPQWLETMLNTHYCYSQSQRLTKGIVNRDLGLKRMPKIKIFLPPISEQNKFEKMKEIIKSLVNSNEQAIIKYEKLFNSLLQQAFNGDLIQERTSA